MSERAADAPNVTGSPKRGLITATFGFFAGLTTIVFYGAAGPIFEEHLTLTGIFHGLLLASPHLSKAVLRIPFGAWVDEVGGRKPMLILLASTIVGIAGLVVTLFLTYPENFDMSLYPLLVLFGLLAGAGGATFSVGISQTSYWYPSDKQGFAMGAFAGVGNIGPGMVTYVLPVLIGIGGLTMAYSTWLVFVVVVTVAYGLLSVNPYYFQLLDNGNDETKAQETASELGQDIFPSGNAWDSLRESATIRRTWILVFLYTVSFGGGFTSLSAWFPTYWDLFHGFDLSTGGLLAGIFIVYGSLIRVPGGSISDRFGGENVAIVSFSIMAVGAGIMTIATGFWLAFIGMMILGTGMGIANAAVFELVPKFVPEAVGGASGWISGIGGGGTLIILPVLGYYVDFLGHIGYARGFSLFVVLSVICAGVALALKIYDPGTSEPVEDTPVH
ncbi:MFS transporter [Halocatena salina]|uniref:MFS transporter n=1 Tax=Halocatena salina TaxID=2934340 RepID=A0A8U0A857_9EURY|nr:MFS transporter [Halocatena salina]UPM45029.1 MFS transporter [Halocatena salina]